MCFVGWRLCSLLLQVAHHLVRTATVFNFYHNLPVLCVQRVYHPQILFRPGASLLKRASAMARPLCARMIGRQSVSSPAQIEKGAIEFIAPEKPSCGRTTAGLAMAELRRQLLGWLLQKGIFRKKEVVGCRVQLFRDSLRGQCRTPLLTSGVKISFDCLRSSTQ